LPFKRPVAPEQLQPPQTPTQNLIRTTKSMGWFPAISIIGIVIGVAGLMNGSRSAMTWIICSAVALWMSLAVARYANVMALIGLVGSVGWFGWSLFIDKGFLTLSRKANGTPSAGIDVGSKS